MRQARIRLLEREAFGDVAVDGMATSTGTATCDGGPAGSAETRTPLPSPSFRGHRSSMIVRVPDRRSARRQSTLHGPAHACARARRAMTAGGRRTCRTMGAPSGSGSDCRPRSSGSPRRRRISTSLSRVGRSSRRTFRCRTAPAHDIVFADDVRPLPDSIRRREAAAFDKGDGEAVRHAPVRLRRTGHTFRARALPQ